MTTVTCQHCGQVFEAQRKTRKFCSVGCANRSEWARTKTRNCRHCGKEFVLRNAGDANRQHCSRQCAKNHNAKRIRAWQDDHPGSMKGYNANRVAKDPDVWKRKDKLRRLRSIDALGGACVVCGVTNPLWLHVDFIPGQSGTPYRHPRHWAYVRDHLDEFRILCANHHYELTLSGRIEGTDIVQGPLRA